MATNNGDGVPRHCNGLRHRREANANNVRCSGGERNKAAGHPSDGNGNGNGDGGRRQALGGSWRYIRWQWKWDFAVKNFWVMGEYNFSD